MDELVAMGFSHALAAQALAATGGKSTLTATEWILGHMDSTTQTPVRQQQQQQQGRVDQFFVPSSGRRGGSLPGVGSSKLGGQMDDQQWRSRHPVNVSPAADVLSDYGSKRSSGSPPVGKAQEEDFGSSMFRRGGSGVPVANQGGKDLCGFTAPLVDKSRATDGNHEAFASSSMKLSKHPHTPGQEPLSNKRQKLNEPSKPQEETAVPVFPPSQSTPTQTFGMRAPAGSRKSLAPLAERMRPSSVELIVGQDHLLGPGCILRSLISNNSLSSIIFWGPPGTGKTSLVRAIARSVSFRFIALSAVSSGLKEVREMLEEAKRKRNFGERTLLFLDEIHRFNKSQQDAFLPYVEAGHIVFIGATTENPSFEINAALLSRCRVLTLNKLQAEHVRILLDRAICDKEKGILLSIAGSSPEDVIKVEEDALQFLAGAADGDARVALNSLEIAGLLAFEAWECTPQRPGPSEKGSSTRGDLPVEVEGEEGRHVDGILLKQDTSPSLMIGPASNSRMDISRTDFGMKRLEVLKGTVKKENLLNSADDYSRPFKRFVGGKEVTPQVPFKEAKEAKEVVSLSASNSGEAEQEGGDILSNTGARGIRERDTSGPLGAEKRDWKVGGNIAAIEDIGKNKKIILVTLQQVQEALQRSHVLYDKTGEEHYNIISALHKSMRGGDPDAAIYWLARMLEGGEGPLYVARRLIRFASEDVGLADPQALMLAVACYQACHFIGMPECNVNLAQCVTYLSLAPKSVIVYHAIEAAQRLVKGSKQNEPVPLHLRNAPTKLMKELGYGRAATQSEQPLDFLPPSLRGQKFLKWPMESPDF